MLIHHVAGPLGEHKVGYWTNIEAKNVQTVWDTGFRRFISCTYSNLISNKNRTRLRAKGEPSKGAQSPFGCRLAHTSPQLSWEGVGYLPETGRNALSMNIVGLKHHVNHKVLADCQTYYVIQLNDSWCTNTLANIALSLLTGFFFNSHRY